MRSSCPRGLGFVACHAPKRSGRGGRTAVLKFYELRDNLELEGAGIEQLPEAVPADAGYWNEQHMDEVVANKHIPVLVAPDKGTRGTPKRWLNSGRAAWMRTVLAADYGHERYRKRKQTVEPLFGNTKHNNGFYRFHRRGRIKVRLEWRLLMMSHNLTKFPRHHLTTGGA